MKAIKITQQDKEANKKLLKNIAVGSILTYEDNKLPKSWYQDSPFSESRADVYNFHNVFQPILQPLERYVVLEASDFNGSEWMQRVELIPQPTTQELYDAKLVEFEQVTDDYKMKLMLANYEDVILGTTTEDFKDLVRGLKIVKQRIKDELKAHFDNDDKQKLKDFTFQTDESVYLESEIKKFKEK